MANGMLRGMREQTNIYTYFMQRERRLGMSVVAGVCKVLFIMLTMCYHYYYNHHQYNVHYHHLQSFLSWIISHITLQTMIHDNVRLKESGMVNRKVEWGEEEEEVIHLGS